MKEAGCEGATDCTHPLPPDPCFLALALTHERQQQIYPAFVEQGVHEHELKFIRGAVQRNQLTGSESFILHVERSTENASCTAVAEDLRPTTREK